MEWYLIKVAACLAIWLTFYKLFLESGPMHLFKRIFLLSTLLSSFLIPLITFTTYVEPSASVLPGPLHAIPASSNVENPIESLHLTFIIWNVYFLGAAVLFLRFTHGLWLLYRNVQKNPRISSGNIVTVLLHAPIAPHSFWKYIFLNKYQYEADRIPLEVIRHEQAHVRQKHSVDILLIELIQVFFWWYPVVYLFRKAIKLNHEFLADQSVLSSGANRVQYQKTLLTYSTKPIPGALVNPIYHSSIKKRFLAMKQSTSQKVFWAKALVGLPILALLLYSFSSHQVIQRQVQNKNQDPQRSQISVVISEDSNKEILDQEFQPQEQATPEMVAEYNRLAVLFRRKASKERDADFEDYKKMLRIYRLMTPAQRATAEEFPAPGVPAAPNPPNPNIPSPPPPPPAPEVQAPDALVPPPAPEVDIPAVPQPPPEPIEHLKELAEQGATFIYKGRKLSANQAIELVRNKENIQIQVTGQQPRIVTILIP